MEVILQLLLTHAILSGLVGQNHLLDPLKHLGWRINPFLYKLQDALDLHQVLRFVYLHGLQEFVLLL